MTNEEALIRQTIHNYAEGGTTGNRQLVAKAFHPSATMKFIKEAVFMDVPIATFLSDYIKEAVVQQRTIEINSIDISGNAAQAKLTIDYSTHQFIDYFNLLKTDGHWLIVSKIFYRKDKV
jgi:Putative lumazine-binding